jgi:hypothetical protein
MRLGKLKRYAPHYPPVRQNLQLIAVGKARRGIISYEHELWRYWEEELMKKSSLEIWQNKRSRVPPDTPSSQKSFQLPTWVVMYLAKAAYKNYKDSSRSFYQETGKVLHCDLWLWYYYTHRGKPRVKVKICLHSLYISHKVSYFTKKSQSDTHTPDVLKYYGESIIDNDGHNKPRPEPLISTSPLSMGLTS